MRCNRQSGCENVVLSKKNIIQNPMPQKLQDSSIRFSTKGELGPKIKPKGIVDGQQVNILILPLIGPVGRRRSNLLPHKQIECLK